LGAWAGGQFRGLGVYTWVSTGSEAEAQFAGKFRNGEPWYGALREQGGADVLVCGSAAVTEDSDRRKCSKMAQEARERVKFISARGRGERHRGILAR